MIAVVTGTRRETRKGEVSRWLDEVKPRLVVVGCCPSGVDREAREWCNQTGVVAVVCTAPWGRLRKGAGPLRNGAIAEVTQALANQLLEDTRCAAFPDEDSVGTHDCARKLYAMGFEVEIRGDKG